MFSNGGTFESSRKSGGGRCSLQHFATKKQNNIGVYRKSTEGTGNRRIRRRSREITRSRILKTAKKLFAEKGYFGTSVKDIAREAGISQRTFYYHFKSKREIADELYKEAVDSLKKGIEQAVTKEETAEAKIRRIMVELFNLAEEGVYIEGKPHNHPEETFTLLREFLKKEKEKGNIRNLNEELYAICLTGAYMKLIKLKREGFIKGELTRYAEELTRCMCRPLKP